MSVLWTMVAVTKCATICQEVMSAPACLATIMMLIILARILMSAQQIMVAVLSCAVTRRAAIPAHVTKASTSCQTCGGVQIIMSVSKTTAAAPILARILLVVMSAPVHQAGHSTMLATSASWSKASARH